MITLSFLVNTVNRYFLIYVKMKYALTLICVAMRFIYEAVELTGIVMSLLA